MLARIIKDEHDNLTWERLTSSVVGSTPLGAVYAIWSNTVPDGFLPCNGAQFDRTQYPFLFSLLGTDYLPDLRECTLVGTGQNNTDTLTTHDIYTLGQFKDFSTAGSGEVKSAGYTVSGNNVVLNSTVNAANRKLVTQYVADADATDLQTLNIGGASVTRARSKGVNYIIKAIPGNEIGDYNYVIDQMEDDLALKVSLEYVNALPTGDDIDNSIYGYQGHFYVPHLDTESPTQSYLTELANFDDIEPVIEWLESTDPLPTGANIKEHFYAQEYTTAGGDTKYNYYIGKVDPSDATNNELVQMETGAGADIFVGTQAEWDALTTAEKNEYSQANITDANSVVHVPVDVVADGNMNPVTSNAVYDKLNGIGVSGLTVDSHISHYTVTKTGNLVIISVIVDFTGVTTGTDINLITGLPKNMPYAQSISVPNEYGLTGTATFKIEANGTKLLGRCSAANNYYYAQIIYSCVGE